MKRRQRWRKVLDFEVKRWSAMSYEQLQLALRDLQSYEIEFESRKYQVEVEILENTEQYVHVRVGVDDGSLPASILPATDTFIVPAPKPPLPTA